MVRFFKYVEKTDTCWLWAGAVNHGGYGVFRFMDRQVRAHRFAWELEHGPIPRGLFVLHRCDNPRCVNPGHLFLGTHRDNMADRSAKGRQAKGESHGRAKLTARQVDEMRRLYATGGVTHDELHRQFGVSHGLISMILNRQLWAEA